MLMKILLSTGSGIGDLMFALPACLALKNKNPHNKCCLLCRGNKNTLKTLNSILDICIKCVDGIEYYNSSEFRHNVSLLYRLYKSHFDYGIVMMYKNQPKSKWPVRILRFTSDETIALRNYVEGNEGITHLVSVEAERLHNVDAYFMPLKYFGIPNEVDKNSYYNKIFDNNKIEKIIKDLKTKYSINNYIVLCVGTNTVKRKIDGKYISNDVKSWAIDNWLETANQLVDAGYQVVLLGGKQENDKLSDAGIVLSESVVNLINKTSINESIAMLSGAQLVVGCDTGLMHCAAALDKKTIMLLGAVAPEQAQGYGPLSSSVYLHKDCSPCYGMGRDLFCSNPFCMTDIKVGDVVRKIKSVL